MKIVLTLTLLLLLSGCATAELAPSSARRKQYVLENTATKDTNFDKAQKWAAIGGGEIRLNDRASGTVVLRANVDCKALKLGNGFAEGESLWFALDLKAEDKKITMTFTDLTAKSTNGSWDSGLRPSTTEETETAAKACLEPMRDSLNAQLTTMI